MSRTSMRKLDRTSLHTSESNSYFTLPMHVSDLTLQQGSHSRPQVFTSVFHR
jgi:hypothetical protein